MAFSWAEEYALLDPGDSVYFRWTDNANDMVDFKIIVKAQSPKYTKQMQHYKLSAKISRLTLSSWTPSFSSGD
jgi:hypothetical protein